jgi:hydrogenase nickel incorporation protein HypA/HybF
MHEAAIAENIIRSMEEALLERPVEGRIARVILQVGKLRGVVAENLQFLFEVLARGSRLEGAGLAVEFVPIVARCRSCGKEFQIEDLLFFCPICRSAQIEIVSGNELQVTGLEVE